MARQELATPEHQLAQRAREILEALARDSTPSDATFSGY